MANDNNENSGSEPPEDDDTEGFSPETEETSRQRKEAYVNFRAAEQQRASSENERIRANNPDLMERAKAFGRANCIRWAAVVYDKNGKTDVPKNCDENRFIVLQTLFGFNDKDRPHYDTFAAKFIDHEGDIIPPKYYGKIGDWVTIFRIMGMECQSNSQTLETLRAFASECERDSLVEEFTPRLPEWDGVQRLETYLIGVFALCDTPVNRITARYFWTSLYARIMMTGAADKYGRPTAPEAPISIMLLGEQNTGKSLFWKRVVEVLMNDRAANTERYRFGMESVQFLRKITGRSLLMSCNEMLGFSAAELEHVKDFFTETSDTYDEKFEVSRHIQRRWCIVGTGNKYEGFQRDTTGNRRMMPYFVNQSVNEFGGVMSDWKREPFRARFDNDRLDGEIMQIMAEAHQWFAENGQKGYDLLISDAIRAVSEFSREELKNDSGTVPSDDLEIYLHVALYYAQVRIGKNHDWSEKVVCVTEGEIKGIIRELSHNNRINFKLLGNKISALGAERRVPGINNFITWAFRNFTTREGFRRWLLERMETTHDVLEQRYGWKLLKGSEDTGF